MRFLRIGVASALVAGVGVAFSTFNSARVAYEGVSWTPPSPPRFWEEDDATIHEAHDHTNVGLPPESKGIPERTPNPVVTLNQYSVADAVDKVSQSLVIIESSAQILWPLIETWTSGSGFIFSEKGRVATSLHLVREASEKLTVTLSDGRSFKAKIVGEDKLTDLALLQLEGIPKHEKLPVAKLGSSAKLRQGELIMAVGNPLSLQNTVAVGVVSAIERDSTELGVTKLRTNYIQTDASINKGNSGGPLINISGEVVGIISISAKKFKGIGFAVPIDLAKEVLTILDKDGEVKRPFLGLMMANLNSRMLLHRHMTKFDLPDVKAGVLVLKVDKRYPAFNAGVRPGDVIVACNNKPVKKTTEIFGILGYDTKKIVTLEIVRGHNETVRFEFKPSPEMPASSIWK